MMQTYATGDQRILNLRESDPLEDVWILLVGAAQEKGVTVPGLHRVIARGI
ncbi:MAG: hypothetical protein ACR2PL_26875 [Dehalococcoidia bacterium]